MTQNTRSQIWDCLIVGAGAAGLMAAIQAARQGCRVLILDSKPKVGAKILMSGGTRCNVTNRKVSESDFQSGNPRVLKSVLQSFRSDEAITFFESLGVALTEEAGGKIFPVTHSGRTVLEALLNEIQKLDIATAWGKCVTEITKRKYFKAAGEGFEFEAKTVVLTTGGLSFPATGSNGGGYQIAQSFGHTLIATSPSLTPLKTGDSEYKALSGISLPVRLTLWHAGKKVKAYDGSMLFTHFGLSGPVVLNISRFWIRLSGRDKTVLRVNYLPAWHEDILREKLREAHSDGCPRLLENWLSDYLPLRFVQAFMTKHGIENEPLTQLPKEQREKLIHFLFNEEISVNGYLGYEKAEVTAGGVSLDEVNRLTLESLKCSGLFFAGEILDADGRIGGFNFQWAWSSAAVAAAGVCRFLKAGEIS